MSLAHLKCELRKSDARVTGRKWEMFQQARTAENHTCDTHRDVCLTYLMLKQYFKIACNVKFVFTFTFRTFMFIFN